MQRFVRTVVLVIAGAAPASLPSAADAQSASCLVSTLNGPVQGIDRGAACVFAGIPFATPPLGALRWKPPQAAAPWAFLDANNTQVTCPSIRLPERVSSGSEDCLTLNVWVRNPLPLDPAPVIVWLHTGAFFGGSSNIGLHNAERLAVETGAIVVAPNYRHGPFGFLAHGALSAEDPHHPASGNYGLMDQRAALAWVRDNIARFGGDARNVTLAGTSAGGESVGLHLVSPASAGLFHRAIIQSGAVTVRWPTRREAEAQGALLAETLGCASAADVLACMRAKTRDDVLLALRQGAQQVAPPPDVVYWLPSVDGIEIPDQPRILFESAVFNQVPTVIGTNRDEGWGAFITRSFPSAPAPAQYEQWVFDEFGTDAAALLAIYPTPGGASAAEQMASLLGDVQFVCEARRLARFIERTRTPTWMYSYEHGIDTLSADHVPHGVEGNILFGNPYTPPLFASYSLTATDNELHAAMAGYWTRFAKTGDPNGDEAVVPWPAFKHPSGAGRGSGKHLVLDSDVRAGMRLQEQPCDRLEPFFFRSLLADVSAGG